MIVDTSALIAVILGEPGATSVRDALAHAEHSRMAAPTYVEFCAVLQRAAKPEISRMGDRLLRAYDVEIAPLDAEQARIAARAYRDYGRGTGHPARLNLGDTFSYALAHVCDEPLLFIGEDFHHTDIRPALR